MPPPKIDSKYLEWETSFSFKRFDESKAQCLVCHKILMNPKKFNVQRHYEGLHANNYASCDKNERVRIASELRSKLPDLSMLESSSKEQKSLTASYAIALLIAKNKKPFTDGKLIKTGAIEMAKAFNLDIAAENFESVSLSTQTISRRVSEIGEQIQQKMKHMISTCKYYSLCLDESTDKSDLSQLSIFIRLIHNDFTIHEDLLSLVPLYGTTKGVDVFNALNDQINKMIGDYGKCTCIVTDGAPAMVGETIGLRGILQKKGVNCLKFHCIIHQEALCGKIVKISETMKIVTKITNMIRGGAKSLSHRKFRAFLEEMNSDYHDIPLHSEIRWLSAAKTLNHFYALRNEILMFLENEVKNSSDMATKMKDINFLQHLAFMTDFTEHLNVLNLKLQTREQTISDLVSHIDGFYKKLELFILELSRNEFHNFPCCGEIQEEHEILPSNIDSFKSTLTHVLDEFKVRFQDFNRIRDDLNLFNNPMQVEIAEQKPEFRLELCDLQGDRFFISRKETGLNFFRMLSNDKYPKLRDFGLKICSMFGSTYNCESSFSIMKSIRNSHRTSLTDSSLSNLMHIAITKIEVDIVSLVNNAPKPQCSH